MAVHIATILTGKIIGKKNVTDGIDMMMTEVNGKPQVAKVTFDADRMTPAECKKWIRNHRMKLKKWNPAKADTSTE